MKKPEATILLTFALIPIAPCHGMVGDSIFDFLFNILFGAQIESGCEQFEGLVNPNNAFDCNCTGGADVFLGFLPVGFDAKTECQLNGPRCLAFTTTTATYCGLATIEAEVGLSFKGELSLQSGKGTFDLTEGPSLRIEVDAELNGPTFEEVKGCTIEIDEVVSGDPSCSCDPCSIDPSKFFYDCSQANIMYGGLTIPGPKTTVCVDFSFIF